ncbi:MULTISPECIES: NAD-dependent epimerase/dehydratase family protein [Streptomyces]|uniref:NAD(P)-dependent oxidoreductase n=1 Tax=Streptomyces flaveolus TaxID=67297 RepID=A0ABV3AI76_9ACTN|nr:MULTISPECIES: NAD(P)-dependent oxidoreductase [Streptomyces]KMS85806.1 hypothetical protein ACZ91_40575 [Streptomyces regensis]KOG67611.1 hypothetical protein ADK77_15705 [Streptomyces antibioticus]KOV83053.1 hypothetical protein ADL02_22270 [Streptomyces sp. NRRL WC-3723]MBG7700300.1 NAD(P)-dependent oxidoreductase [Streptomyces sp. MC1]
MTDTGTTILVTGATGFVGHRVVHHLRDHPARPRLRLLAHRTDVPECCAAQSETVRGSVTDPVVLRAACTGVRTVLHLASAITEDAVTAQAVNATGTASLVTAARHSGVRRIVRLGTAAVYGLGPHRGEARPPVRPLSVLSASRQAGDRSVLTAGGIVLRPHLVYGAGDRWFVPALVRMITRLPHWINGGRARLSLISVDDLARVTAALATRPDRLPASAVLHPAHPAPVSMRDLVTVLCRHLDLPLPRGDMTPSAALERLAAAGEAPLARRLAQLGVDHWFDSASLWKLAGVTPGPAVTEHFAACAPWYRRHLTDTDVIPATATA